MVEIGSRWQRISQSQKEHYKKLAEEQQRQYKVHLDLWVKVSERAGPLGREREAGARATQKSCSAMDPDIF